MKFYSTGATSISTGPNGLPATATVTTSSSVQNLVDSCVSVLVTLHKETILSECADMIRANETEKLQLMVRKLFDCLIGTDYIIMCQAILVVILIISAMAFVWQLI